VYNNLCMGLALFVDQAVMEVIILAGGVPPTTSYQSSYLH